MSEINWDSIESILRESKFLNKDNENLIDLCEGLENCYEDDEGDQETLKHDLCEAITTQKDDKLCCYQLLTNEYKLNKSNRLQLYKILLYRYIKLNELNLSQMINILKSNITKLKATSIDLVAFESEARKQQLDGSTFESISNEQFANMFIGINSSKTIWKEIYGEEIKKWRSPKSKKKVHFCDDDDEYKQEEYLQIVYSDELKEEQKHIHSDEKCEETATYYDEIKSKTITTQTEESSLSESKTSSLSKQASLPSFGGMIKRPKLKRSEHQKYPYYINKAVLCICVVFNQLFSTRFALYENSFGHDLMMKTWKN